MTVDCSGWLKACRQACRLKACATPRGSPGERDERRLACRRSRGRSRRAARYRRLDGGARRRARTPDRGREPPACRRALDRHRPRRARAARHVRRLADRAADAHLPRRGSAAAHRRPLRNRPRADGRSCARSIRSPSEAGAAPNAILVALDAVGRNVAEIGGVARAGRAASRRAGAGGRSARSRIRGGLRFTSIVHHLEQRRLARGADHRAHHVPDRRHPGAAGHFPFPHLRRRHVCRRHGRHAGAARDRRADRLRSWWPAAPAAPTPPNSAR